MFKQQAKTDAKVMIKYVLNERKTQGKIRIPCGLPNWGRGRMFSITTIVMMTLHTVGKIGLPLVNIWNQIPSTLSLQR